MKEVKVESRALSRKEANMQLDSPFCARLIGQISHKYCMSVKQILTEQVIYGTFEMWYY